MYNPDASKTKQRAAAFGFGTERRKDATSEAKKSVVPGPNTYGLPSTLNEGPKISFGAKNDRGD